MRVQTVNSNNYPKYQAFQSHVYTKGPFPCDGDLSCIKLCANKFVKRFKDLAVEKGLVKSSGESKGYLLK